MAPLGDDDLLAGDGRAGRVDHGDGRVRLPFGVSPRHGSANPAAFGRTCCEDGPVTAQVLSTRVLNRTLLARQHLLARASMPAIDMVEHLVGMQAQIPTNPYLGLWSRLAGFEPAELEGLLLDRRAVRMVVMRGTIHLLSTDDALALRPVMQPVLDDELFKNKTWSVGLEGVDIGPVLELGRRMVEQKPRPLQRAAGGHRGTLAGSTTRRRSPTPVATSCRRSRSRRVACGTAAARSR